MWARTKGLPQQLVLLWICFKFLVLSLLWAASATSQTTAAKLLDSIDATVLQLASP
jgi:hypothetical protein